MMTEIRKKMSVEAFYLLLSHSSIAGQNITVFRYTGPPMLALQVKKWLVTPWYNLVHLAQMSFLTMGETTPRRGPTANCRGSLDHKLR